MGLLGWVPPFRGNPQAGKSGLCAGNYGPQYLLREKRNLLWDSGFSEVVLLAFISREALPTNATEKPLPCKQQGRLVVLVMVEEDH